MNSSGKELTERQKKSRLKASVREWKQRKREYEAIRALGGKLEKEFRSSDERLTKFVSENFGKEPFLLKLDKNTYRVGIVTDRIWGDKINIERLKEK